MRSTYQLFVCALHSDTSAMPHSYHPVFVSILWSVWEPCMEIIQELSMPVLHIEKNTDKGCIIDHCLENDLIYTIKKTQQSQRSSNSSICSFATA